MNSVHLSVIERIRSGAVAIAGIVMSSTPGIFLCALLTTAAYGQGAAPDADDAAAAPSPEGPTVTGLSRAELQREIELATEALLERFNEINSNSDFDTECRERQLTGSNMSRVTCEPKFMEEANAARGRQRLQGLQGPATESGSAGGGLGAESGGAQLEASVRLEEMGDEMMRLINEDDEFRALAAHLGALQQALADDGGRDSSPGRTSAVIASAADSELPYGARLMADVRMGRNAWEHTLINRTFAIAHLYGEIDSMELRCEDHRARFEYEPEAEWTVPEGWEKCRLTIDAPRGTAFTLFEFE